MVFIQVTLEYENNRMFSLASIFWFQKVDNSLTLLYGSNSVTEELSDSHYMKTIIKVLKSAGLIKQSNVTLITFTHFPIKLNKPLKTDQLIIEKKESARL